MINKQSYQITGMRQDNLVGTGFSSKFAHEIMNMRLNTIGDYTTASWTTEKGTLEKPIIWDKDVPTETLEALYASLYPNGSTEPVGMFNPIGQAVINDQWIVFCVHTNNNEHIDDAIFKIYYKNGTDDLYGQLLYIGNLNFDEEHPIETLISYENENLQKVYWVDGKNQPRMINVAPNGIRFYREHDTQFDFVKELDFNEQVTVTKHSGAGVFPPGTVKYALTYYSKYAQESNVFWTSGLYYPTLGERACSPDEISGDEFHIDITNISNDMNESWDGVRLYSIIRTSDNATPIVRLVDEKPISRVLINGIETGTVSFVDTNTTGEIIESERLHYAGGKNIVASTIQNKENTLFLGDITLKQKSLKNIIEDDELGNPDFVLDINNDKLCKSLTISDALTVYPWISQLNGADPKIFKFGETYRVGIQCQDKYGVWSDVKWLNDIDDTTIPISETINGVTTVKYPVISYTLPSTIVNKLHDEGFKQARLVCCYPSLIDRTVLAQGVVCKTLLNKEWKDNHSPDYISSWFYRFGNASGDITKEEVQSIEKGFSSSEEAKLNYGGSNNREAQWPNSCYKNNKHEDQFTIANNTYTFHSPDIEFDDRLKTLDLRDIKLKVVGFVPKSTFASSLYIDSVKQAADYTGNKGKGLLSDFKTKTTDDIINTIGESSKDSHGVWNDLDVYCANLIGKDGDGDGHYQIDFVRGDYEIYPFQRKYLGNYMGDTRIKLPISGSTEMQDRTITESSVINNKVWATLQTSTNNILNTYTNEFKDIQDIQIFDSNEVIPIKLKSGDIYYGNVNSIAPVSRSLKLCVPIFKKQGLWKANEEAFGDDFDTVDSGAADSDTEDSRISRQLAVKVGSYRTTTKTRWGWAHGVWIGVSSDPVPMNYRSTPHCVFQTNNLNLGEQLDDNDKKNSLLLVELYRPEVKNKFGGNSEAAHLNNIYIPSSTTSKLIRDNDINLTMSNGDTYYMRYDNLKTYPPSSNEINGIVEIMSFMCETRINLDGRYDKNRGLTDNTYITNTNFDLINKSYTQADNYFTYQELDDLSASLDKFPNQFTWTKEKVYGDIVDTWTNITLASTADADGTVGQIRRILNLKDTLYLFQDHGICSIGFNEKTAISVENGVPLEIANSGKYTGLSYKSRDIGCQNKWSISNTKNGIFFIDDSRQELLALGENIQSLSTANGFDAFLIQQLPKSEHFKPWNPKDFNNFVTYYDKLGNDIFFINKDYSLAWNEITNAFTSFYSYNNVPIMANVGTHLLMWKGNFIINVTETEDEVITTEYGYPQVIEPTGQLTTIWNYGVLGGAQSNYYDLNCDIHYQFISSIDEIRNRFIRLTPLIDISNDWNCDLLIDVLISLPHYLNQIPPQDQIHLQVRITGTFHITSSTWENPQVTYYYELPQSLNNYIITDYVNNTISLNSFKVCVGCEGDYPEILIGNFNITPNTTEVISDNQLWSNTFINDDGTNNKLFSIISVYDYANTSWVTISQDGDCRVRIEYLAATKISNYSIFNTTPMQENIIKTTIKRFTIPNSGNLIWAAREDSTYSTFFGNTEDYWMTLVCDGQTDKGSAFPADKVFNNIEFRSDIYNIDNPHGIYNTSPFNIKSAWNCYQLEKETSLDGIRKFNTWRVQLPRASYDGLTFTRDRIRNPFCYIKLKQNQSITQQTDRMILHDLAVYFDMK